MRTVPGLHRNELGQTNTVLRIKCLINYMIPIQLHEILIENISNQYVLHTTLQKHNRYNPFKSDSQFTTE